MKPEKEAYITALAAHPNLSERAVCDVAGINYETFRAWKKKDVEFRAVVARVKTTGRSTLKTAPVSANVPDFLEWRTRHCAYISQRDGRVHRAENNWYQQDAVKHLEENNRIIMVLPPGHIKTTLFGIEYSTWAIQRNRNIRIMNVQKSEPEAAKVIDAVEGRLSDHDYYAHMAAELARQGEEAITDPIKAYGGKVGYKPRERVGAKWGAYGFAVSGITSGEKDLTMQAKGVSSQMQGVRGDLIILDDVQDPRNISPADTAKLADWFQRVVIGRLADTSKLVILCNLFHPEDFANWLINTYGEMWPVIKYPAVLEDGSPLCPEFWTPEGLAQKRQEVGEQVWHYTWMQDLGNFAGATFQRASVEAARNFERRMGEVPAEVTDAVIGIDPATSGFTAVVGWGVDRRTGRRYLLDLVNEEGLRTWEANVEKVVAMATDLMGRRAPLKRVVVEVRSTQGSLYEDIRKALSPLGLQVVAYKTATSMGAQAEETDFNISSIGRLFDDGLVDLPYGDPRTQKAIDAYINQLCNWRPRPPGRTSWHLVRDMVMGTLFAESEARQFVARALEVKVPRPSAPRFAYGPGGKGWSWQRDQDSRVSAEMRTL